MSKSTLLCQIKALSITLSRSTVFRCYWRRRGMGIYGAPCTVAITDGLLRCRLDPGQLPRVFFVFTEFICASVSLLSGRGILRPTMTTALPPPPPTPTPRCLCSCPITPLYLVRLLCCLLMSNTDTIRALIMKPNRIFCSQAAQASWWLSRRELRLRACVAQKVTSRARLPRNRFNVQPEGHSRKANQLSYKAH